MVKCYTTGIWYAMVIVMLIPTYIHLSSPIHLPSLQLCSNQQKSNVIKCIILVSSPPSSPTPINPNPQVTTNNPPQMTCCFSPGFFPQPRYFEVAPCSALPGLARQRAGQPQLYRSWVVSSKPSEKYDCSQIGSISPYRDVNFQYFETVPATTCRLIIMEM